MDYDLFISHASEDKDSFVRPLAIALMAAGLRVWYDEMTLDLGDNLRRSIDEGLAKSKYGVVVLSRSFLAKNWPQWELDGLIQRHVGGANVILPIWHGVTAEEIRQYSPALANIVAMKTEDGLAEIVEAIISLFASHEFEDTQFRRDEHMPSTRQTRQKHIPHVSMEQGSRRVVVTGLDEFDETCMEFEQLLETGDGAVVRDFVLENPQLLCFLLRQPFPSIVQSRPILPPPYIFDAFALCIPQWVEVTLFKLGSPDHPPFDRKGVWSRELLEAIGTVTGWTYKGNHECFYQLAGDVAAASRRQWPSRSGYDSIHTLTSSVRRGSDRTTFVLLFGRHRMINERSRSFLHSQCFGRATIELRSYDVILWGLYSLCPKVDFSDPITVAKLDVEKSDQGSIRIDDSYLVDVEEKLLKSLGRSRRRGAEIKIVGVTLRPCGNLEDIPRSKKEPYSSSCREMLPLAFSNENPNERWSQGTWYHPAIYNVEVSPSTLRRTFMINYSARNVPKPIHIDFVISAVRYRELGAKLNTHPLITFHDYDFFM